MNTGADTKPDKNWDRGTITTDLMSALNSTGREELLTVWQANVDTIFSTDNLSKLEMAFGDKYVGALKDILRRMKTGRNSKAQTGNEETSAWADFFTNSVGNIMFLNSRSAILQLISATNFINFRENNIIAAGKALMNQKQYWSDFKMLWNSDFLVDRRDGLKLNVNEADLADVARTDGIQGVIARLLKAGFAPTKYADSLAISLGGATYFRTKYDSLVKKGMNPKEAHRVAMQEFTEIAQESQQSSRPDKISKEQSEPIGRLILAFANTPQQYARIIKRAGLDLINGRGNKKENISRIMYYGAIQNAIFAVLQQGIFAMAFDSDELEEESIEKEMANVGNSMLNSLLRGLGLYGAVAATLKDVGSKMYERSQAKRPQYSKYLMKTAVNISPPIGSKVIKMMRAADTYEWNEGFLFDEEGVDENEYAKLPGVRMTADITAAATSIPADRILSKVSNLLDMIQTETDDSYRALLAVGYPEWQMEQKSGDERGVAKREAEKERRKVIKKQIKEDDKRSVMNADELEIYDLKKLKKNEQVEMLFDLGLYSRDIRKLTKEEDRINKIIELQNKQKRNDSLK
jgi:endonuclease III